MIPLHFHLDDIRLIKIEAKNKKPIEQGWTTTNNYCFNDEIIIKWIEGGGNYGVACGFGNIIVIDCDNQQLHEIIEKELPETFTVKTGGGGYHHYYILPNQKKIIFEKDGVHLGELQSQGQQVVGPGSIHPNGNKYEIVKDIPITILNNGIITEKIPKEIVKGGEINKKSNKDKRNDFNLNILDVVPLSGLKKKASGEYQGAHPVHSSNDIKNEDHDFTINPQKNVWHCFWHNCGGGPLEWIGIQEGIIQCGDRLEKGNFFRVLDIGKKKYGLIDNQTSDSQKRLESTIQPLLEPLSKYPKFSHIDNLGLRVNILAAKADDNPAQATELMVEYIEENNNIYTIRDDTIKEVWMYSDGIYKPNGISIINEMIRDVMGEQYTTNYSNKVMDKIMADTYIDQDEFFNVNYVDEIAVLNGLLNLNTLELSTFDPNKIFFSKIPITYDTSKDCPGVQSFFTQILKNPEDLPVIQELFGYLLWKEYFIERAIMLTGTGRNGKGKTLELMKRFVGVENISSIPLQQMDEDMYSISELQNKLANLAGDLDSKALKHSGRFKELTGRDNITAARKFKTRVTFTNYAKLIFAANDIPQTNDITDAFFMRWVILEFPYKFLKQEEYDKITDAKELSYVKVRDPNIIDKISTPDELSGLLNWAIIGLHRLKAQKDFGYNKSIKEVQNIWIKKSDSFTAFCMDMLEENYDNEISKGEIRQSYTKYCKKHRLRPLSDKHIQHILTTMFGVFDRRSIMDDNRERVWVGVDFKPKSKNEVLRSENG